MPPEIEHYVDHKINKISSNFHVLNVNHVSYCEASTALRVSSCTNGSSVSKGCTKKVGFISP